MTTIRKANPLDIEGVLALQALYLVVNIPEDQKTGGFVTTPFTVSQIEDVIAADCLFVALEAEKVVAYVFTGSWDFFASWPIFPFMESRLMGKTFENQIITKANSFQYGPVCIHENQRGSGLFQKIFDFMQASMAARYPIGLTFINKINQRSFDAHTKKLPLVVIDEFEFNSNQYHGLAFLTKQKAFFT